MGFEVIYYYHERDKEGYNQEEKKSLKKKVGDPFEEVSLNKLAGVIMGQMARRDIWVVDVEIYELSKKQVSFRESNGGIIVKNKKFTFDDSSNMVAQEVHEIVPQRNLAQPANLVNNSIQSGKRPLRYMVFAPELPMMVEIRQRNLSLTPENKYPIFSEGPHPTGVGFVYKTLDDNGREIDISDKYFVPIRKKLVADELGFSESPEEREGGRLLWGGATREEDMPKIR